MAALTNPRDTYQLGDKTVVDILSLPVKGAVKPIQGGILVLNAGYAAPATTAAGLIAVGIARETVDNTAGADGALNVPVRQGTLGPFENSASGDLITQAHVGTDCYLVDDHTLAHTSNSAARSRAARVLPRPGRRRAGGEIPQAPRA